MNRIRGSIFFSVFAAMLGLMLIAPIMPPLIRELGMKESHSGLIISLGSIMMAVMAPVWGRWSDIRGRKPIILIGFIGMSVSLCIICTGIVRGIKCMDRRGAPVNPSDCDAQSDRHVHSGGAVFCPSLYR